MNNQEKAISEKAVRNMIKDLKEQELFGTFAEVSEFVKTQFSNKTGLAKVYIKAAL